jgi:hypothetical protein
MSEVITLHHQLEEAKMVIKKTERLERLLKNADFREVIVNGFARDDAARYVQESCDPSLDADSRADALAIAQAPGHLKRWINAQLQMANFHRNNIPQIEEAIAELRQSGQDEPQQMDLGLTD